MSLTGSHICWVSLGVVLLLGWQTSPVSGTEPTRTPAKPTPPNGPGKIDFNRDIRPILAENCFGCHGPDAHSRKGDLRLDVKKAVFEDRGGYHIVVPGKLQESELLIRIDPKTRRGRMPPRKSGRRLTTQQVRLLREWVAQGAVWDQHWAFTPIQRPGIPKVSQPHWCQNPVDRFVLARLQTAGLAPSSRADRTTLIRRLHLDLLGLPPAPATVDAFVNDDEPGAYLRLVDRLLASPHLGERWGRHWLDLARYADSDGYEDDRVRPDAWRYRDWVIEAFNADMPFDQFTVEQMAGDLLPSASYQQKLATGFHRMNVFNRVAVGRENEEEFRVKRTKDRANTTGIVWLGITLGCAECHDHKYDPIPQRDYYRFYAFFNNVTEKNISAPPTREKYYQIYQQRLAMFEARQARAEAALAAYEKDILPGKQSQWEKQVSRKQLPAKIVRILNVKPQLRTEEQNTALGEYFRSLDPDYQRLAMAVLSKEQLKNNRPDPPSTRALTLARKPRQTFVQIRGNHRTPGKPVTPGSPAFLPPLQSKSQPGRLELARWLIDPRHPLTSRVAVNAIWQHLFGQGLVRTPENFGRQGEPPSHPQLLDWLATEFIRSGWSRKKLIRLIVTSATYQQASHHRRDIQEDDPGNRLLARQNRFRVEAEIIRDLALASSGQLNTEMGGPGIQPPLPLSLRNRPELQSEQLLAVTRGVGRYRRGIYIHVQRTFPYPMLKDFDASDATASCTRRDRSNTPLQALTLWNDPVFTKCARSLALRVLRESSASQPQRIRHAFRLCLARSPSTREANILAQVYQSHHTYYRTHGKAARDVLDTMTLPKGVARDEAAAWVAMTRTLLNLDEFITRE